MEQGIYYPIQGISVVKTKDGQKLVRGKSEGATVSRNHRDGLKRMNELTIGNKITLDTVRLLRANKLSMF